MKGDPRHVQDVGEAAAHPRKGCPRIGAHIVAGSGIRPSAETQNGRRGWRKRYCRRAFPHRFPGADGSL